MPRLSPYLARKGGSFLYRRRPPVHSRLAGCGLNTRKHMAVALRTRDPREAGRRAAALNAVAEVGWVMELPGDEVRDILRALARKLNDLPRTMSPEERVEAERRLENEAVLAFQGNSNQLKNQEVFPRELWGGVRLWINVADNKPVAIIRPRMLRLSFPCSREFLSVTGQGCRTPADTRADSLDRRTGSDQHRQDPHRTEECSAGGCGGRGAACPIVLPSIHGKISHYRNLGSNNYQPSHVNPGEGLAGLSVEYGAPQMDGPSGRAQPTHTASNRNSRQNCPPHVWRYANTGHHASGDCKEGLHSARHGSFDYTPARRCNQADPPHRHAHHTC